MVWSWCNKPHFPPLKTSSCGDGHPNPSLPCASCATRYSINATMASQFGRLLSGLHADPFNPAFTRTSVLGCSNRPFVLEVQEKHKNQNLPIPRCLPSKDPEMCENVLNSAFCPCVQPFYAGGLSTKLHSIQLNLKNLTRKGSIP